VEEIKVALASCRVFLFFPIYWMWVTIYICLLSFLKGFVRYGWYHIIGHFPKCWTILSRKLARWVMDSTPDNTSRVNLPFLLELHGIPNDILTNIDALTIIAFIPILNTCLYPILRRGGILFRPIARITVGFIFAGLAMLYAAGVQHLIYISVICENTPLICFQFTNIGLLATLLRFSSQLWRL
jgi:POT family proton-dependent oligopeptide transporter